MDTKEHHTPWKDSRVWVRIPDHDETDNNQVLDWVIIFLIGIAGGSVVGCVLGVILFGEIFI